MKYILVISIMFITQAAVAHPHHPCTPDDPHCKAEHSHPGNKQGK